MWALDWLRRWKSGWKVSGQIICFGMNLNRPNVIGVQDHVA
ncbi:hypothetical protein N9Q18_01685 [bacterium]|nr:hypothetical protein [bacterium]